MARRRDRSSVVSSTSRASATIAASGKSSCSRSVEYTTKGAVPNRSAAVMPVASPPSNRPSSHTATMPSARKASMTTPAAASTGITRDTAPVRHSASGG